MKVLALNPITKDLQFGTILENSSDAVAQCVTTRLRLFLGEWFLNISDGTDWYGSVLGYNTPYDLTIQDRILGTLGVTEILTYSSSIDKSRNLTVSALLQTSYSNNPIPISVTLAL